MVPRLRLSHQDRSWPELFKATHLYRKLRVVVDAELLDDATTWTAENLVAGFLSHTDVECWKYRDDGPPPRDPRVTSLLASGQRQAGQRQLRNRREALPRTRWSTQLTTRSRGP